MTIAALVIGLLILVQGLAGLASPDTFVAAVRMFQEPPVIYFAAVVRVAFGVVLVLAAPVSRFPRLLRGLGVLIVVGGALTPVVGLQFAQVVLGWWSSGGAWVVRAWAAVALLLGAFILFAVSGRKNAA